MTSKKQMLVDTETIIIATPHSRYDVIENHLITKLPVNVIRIRKPDELTLDSLKEIGPKYVFFPHWSWIIPSEIFENFECIIFHMTDLPFGRGGSPLQNLIANGMKETKLSAIKCIKDIDAGPIYLKNPLSLNGTAEEILKRAALEMIPMIEYIVSNSPVPIDQVGLPTSFKRRKPEESNIEELTSLEKVHDYIRMLDADGYPNAFIETAYLRLELTESKLHKNDITAKVKISRKES